MSKHSAIVTRLLDHSTLRVQSKILAELRRQDGRAATWAIARQIMEPTAKVRAELKILATVGVVERSEFWSSRNSIVWRLANSPDKRR